VADGPSHGVRVLAARRGPRHRDEHGRRADPPRPSRWPTEDLPVP
jgi:hypothetical protein